MQKTILIIDDDTALRETLAKGLRGEGFAVVGAENAEHAFQILDKMTFDAIVLDRMMPGTDGLTALGHMRARGMDTPVIMLTALGGTENTVAGLSGGADDYLAKPFSLKELSLRLSAVTRRKGVAAPAMPKGLSIENGEFFIKNQLLELSAAEKEFLLQLVSPVGNHAAAPPMVAKRLREKLLAPLPGLDIITVRGKGYKLVTGGSCG
ncbi:MAG: response regulator transcription factor [Alphaproteobacteria bacterium]|nr:response regulator transcription factor [Alphaproteobacteria bacterium]